jgi:hypothetical protein
MEASMNAQHTPGPWRAAYITREEVLVVRSADSEVALVANDNDANARLIAAAPELLAALKNLLAGPTWPGAQMTARAAIAKAEGSAE